MRLTIDFDAGGRLPLMVVDDKRVGHVMGLTFRNLTPGDIDLRVDRIQVRPFVEPTSRAGMEVGLGWHGHPCIELVK